MTDMTVTQVAQLCGVTERTVRRWLKDGRLAGVRVGGRVRISPHAVGELAAPYGDVTTGRIATEPMQPAAESPHRLQAYLEDPERLAAVRARRAARTIELLDRVRALAREHPASPGVLDPEGIIRAVRDEQDDRWDEWLGSILDASVIVGWFLHDEPDADRAAALRGALLAGGDQAIVPRVCWTEVSHALVRAVRRGRLPAVATESVIEALAGVIALVESRDVDPVESLRVALDLDLGAYDSGYLVLSRMTRQPLITADRRLYEVGIAAGYDTVWMGDLAVG